MPVIQHLQDAGMTDLMLFGMRVSCAQNLRDDIMLSYIAGVDDIILSHVASEHGKPQALPPAPTRRGIRLHGPIGGSDGTD